MKTALRLGLVLLLAAGLSQCRALRKFSPWEVYRSANCHLPPKTDKVTRPVLTPLEKLPVSERGHANRAAIRQDVAIVIVS